ncbi:hypothetical protein Hdeb2414_s0002g00047021 [Helianthus debilis subsp. tardiflorus]
MKSKKLGFLFLLLCVQLISSLAFESQEEKVPIDMDGNSYGRVDGVNHDEIVLSKGSSGKGTYGGQNNRPPNTKKSQAASMLLNELGYMLKVVISVIVITNVILIY